MIFRGSATALITPFKNDGIDFDALDKLLEFQLAEGINAIVTLGTTGEPATMTAEEKRQVVEFTIKKVNKKVPVIIGTGSNNTAHAVEESVIAEKMGADALLVVTPYYNKCTQDGLVAHYLKIADAINVPIICYNVPGRTGVNMLPSTFAKAAEHPNIQAMKEASGNMEQIMQCIQVAKGKAVVYCGDDALAVPTMAMGGQGIISVASNVIPYYVSSMCREFFSGNAAKAASMQLDMLNLVKALFSEVNPIPVKMAAKFLGIGNGEVRLPLTEMTAENAKKLRDTMNNL